MKENIIIHTNSELFDIDMIYNYLHNESYWAKNIPRHMVERAIKKSLCFGLFINDKQVAFARVISDYTTFAYLCDVFVLPAFQRSGLGKILMQNIADHKELKGLRRFMLATRDAQKLYEKFGFTPLANPLRLMEKVVIDPYTA